MPRKAQGWITFQSSEEERQILDHICQQTQRTKTEVLREILRNLGQQTTLAMPHPEPGGHDEELVDVVEGQVVDDLPEEGNSSDAMTLPAATPPLHMANISARNVLKATVKKVVRGAINAEVTLTIAPGVELVSVITRSSADMLKLKQGKTMFAVIKSNNVMLAEPHT